MPLLLNSPHRGEVEAVTAGHGLWHRGRRLTAGTRPGGW